MSDDLCQDVSSLMRVWLSHDNAMELWTVFAALL